MPVIPSHPPLPLDKRATVFGLKWAARLSAVYVVGRFILAVPCTILDDYTVVNYLHFLLPVTAVCLVAGLWGASNMSHFLPAVRRGLSVAVGATAVWLALSLILIWTTRPIGGINDEVARLLWDPPLLAFAWIGAFIGLAGWLYTISVLKSARVLTNNSCLELNIGVACLTINWLFVWPGAANFTLLLSFIALGSLGLSTGLRQLAIVIAFGQDEEVSTFDF